MLSSMPSAFSHLLVGAALAAPFGAPARFVILCAACAALPDLDVAGFAFGVPYAAPLGHRGFTHSLSFAVLLAGLLVALPPPLPRARAWLCLFLATASHGVLDAMTDGGLGVAFFLPWDAGRYFLPWRPILVSPIGVGAFASERGAAVLASEAVWIGLPALVFALGALSLRRGARAWPRYRAGRRSG